ncbi:MAG: acetylxylan esterase, partial [Lentisphaeria bacterium]|nr:acetylxylan esterase [Lentisphaeria bacterium]
YLTTSFALWFKVEKFEHASLGTLLMTKVNRNYALEYYDPVFMAKRIRKAKIVITRAGLGDYTSPPSGLAICYNNLATPEKTIKWYQGSNHTIIPPEAEIITWTAGKKVEK